MSCRTLSECPKLCFKRLTEHAQSPIRASPQAAGLDLFSAYDYEVEPLGKELIKTDLRIQIPDGYYGRIAPRSGLAWKHYIDVGAGVIDNDYRGNVCVLLFNHSSCSFKVNRGDRIAQLICEKICFPELVEIEVGHSRNIMKNQPILLSEFGSNRKRR